MYKFEEKKHIHTLDDKPLRGTTSVLHEVLPPMLSWYASAMACKTLGWTSANPTSVYFSNNREIAALPIFEKIKSMSDINEYLDLLETAYKAHNTYMKEKGDWGTDTHAAIEKAVNEAITSNNGLMYYDTVYENEAVERFASWARGKTFLHSEVHCYSRELWLGGIIDLVYKYKDEIFIGDIKTNKKGFYPSQFIQEGMYDYQQYENGLYTADGQRVHDGYKIAGYTIINIPKDEGIFAKTYRGTEQLKAFTKNICQMHTTLQELETILKK